MEETIILTDNISKADAVLGLHSKLKKNSHIQTLAGSYDIPIFVTKVNFEPAEICDSCYLYIIPPF